MAVAKRLGPTQALCLAVRDRIRSELGYNGGQCEYVEDPEGRPPPEFAGDVFAAVHDGQEAVSDVEEDTCGRTEIVMVQVTLTERTTWLPQERIGPSLLADANRWGSRAEAIKDALTVEPGRTSVIEAATAYLVAVNAADPGFGSERLSYLGPAGPPESQFEDWFGVLPTEPNLRTLARSQTLMFGSVRYFRAFDEEE